LCCKTFTNFPWLGGMELIFQISNCSQNVWNLLLFDQLMHQQLHNQSTVYPFLIWCEYMCVCKFAGHPICDNKACLQELVPADQQVLGWAAVASADLACGLVGRCEGMSMCKWNFISSFATPIETRFCWEIASIVLVRNARLFLG
jgi:hypothetical protein